MKIRTSTLLAAALLTLSAPTIAAANSASGSAANASIFLGTGSFNNWRAVGRDELILWATPSKPYLLKIWRPVTSLRFVQTIGVTTTAGRVTKFDTVIVDGQRLPIKYIIPLDKETAKELRWQS